MYAIEQNKDMFKVLWNESEREYVIMLTLSNKRNINPKAKRKADEVLIFKTKDRIVVDRMIKKYEEGLLD